MKRRISPACGGMLALTICAWSWSGAGAGSCGSDLDGSGVVNGLDLGILLANWSIPVGAPGCGGAPGGCAADINEDGVVDGLDLGILLANWNQLCGPIDTELAGNSLAIYPHFEYVRAFNEGSPLRVAIDPTRFPQIAGQTCDIYIVAAKTAAQWASDPSLVDATGGAQSQTFGGATIQANTFTISGSQTLSGDAGAGLGVGYDVVFDCNRNGMLDAADAIDGLSDEAGLYVVHDTTQPGPFVVTEVDYSVTGVTAGFENANLFYPSNIDALGQLPLVVIGHGGPQSYHWYDHVGVHLASYGYIVTSHANNTAPGVFTASTTTLEHTEAIIAQQAAIADGALDGHIDANRIVWIGHSRGGEGVVIAFDRVVDGSYVPEGFSAESIRLISSMAPTDFLGTAMTNPHNVPYHVWVAQADNNVNGCASCDLCQPMQIHDRAGGFRQATYIHGMGHEDFSNSTGSSFASGPCLIGRPTSHQIMLGYLLPLVLHYVEGNAPAKDFLTRQWESFHPIGAPASNPCVHVDLVYRDAPGPERLAIDDFQSAPEPTASSSGGTVSYNVANLVEDRLDDANGTFEWTDVDPMNGMTVAGAGDVARGVVFDWSGPAFYEQAVAPGASDFGGFAFLTFRAAQGTRHPNTTAELGDLTFDVVLRDSAGHTSRINIGAYGGGLEEPYHREGCGAVGAGWQNEFETIRIRLTDFLNNGSDLDLTSIAAIRLEFAGPGVSSIGRIGLDDILLIGE